MKKPKSPVKKDRRHMVPDTNILWHETKDVPVSPDFAEFVVAYCGEHNVGIHIPEVVHGELLYQHTSTALELLQKAERTLDTLSAVAASSFRSGATSDRVKSGVEKKLRAWASGCGANFISTPINEIDWSRVANDAIWRVPPFTEDKKAKSEKGFRDSLILETVVAYADRHPSAYVDFVSNDKVLREAVKVRTKGKRVGTFESLSDYTSHLRLLDQKLTEEFVSSISNKASEKFLAKAGKACLWRDEKIAQQVREQFPDKLTPPPESTSSQTTSSLLLGLFPKGPDWKKVTEESVWIFRPAFQSREGKNTYLWASRFQFIQFFKNNGSSSGAFSPDKVQAGELRIRKVIFQAKWKATVGTDGRFKFPKLTSIEHIETEFRPPTENELSRYGSEIEE